VIPGLFFCGGFEKLNEKGGYESIYFVMQSEPVITVAPFRTFQVLRGTHWGMCFGVRDAISMALEYPGPLTILGDLVHNESVLASLRERGIRIVQRLEDVETPAVMITAHGASEKMIALARARGLKVVEATCPLVRHAHRELLKLASEGWHPVVIGKRGHVEVRGLTEDLERCDIVLCVADVELMEKRERFGVIAQTTQPSGKVRSLLERIRYRFPASEIRFVDTVCQPTKLRQSSAIELSQKCEVVIVIGGANSNNTKELASTCSRFCSRVYHVNDGRDLRIEWFENARTIGITAGTSTPDHIVDEVEAWINSHLRTDASTY